MGKKLQRGEDESKIINLTLLLCLLMATLTVKGQSSTALGQQMAKQVNEIRSGMSATMSSNESSSTDDTNTAALIAGIPKPKSQAKSNISLQREYYSNFVGPIASGKILVPVFNPKCTLADVNSYMSLPNVDKESQAGVLSYTIYKDNTKDEPLAIYSYMFMNGSFMSATVTFTMDIDRDKCLAWMVQHYKYKDSNVENGQDSHQFTTKDGKISITVNFTNVNGESTHAMIMYLNI